MRASGMTARGGGAIARRTIGGAAATGRHAIAGRIIGAWNALCDALRPPAKGPAWADVSTDATNPHAAKMARMLATIRTVIALVPSALSGDHMSGWARDIL